MHGTILIFEKRSVARECLKTFLQSHLSDLKVVGLASADQATPLAFPDVDGILTSDAADLGQLRRSFPDAALLLIDDGRSGRVPSTAQSVPVLTHDLPAEAFVHAVREAFQRQPRNTPTSPFRANGSGAVADEEPEEPDEPPIDCLSERERDVLAALQRGLSNKIIAAELQLSENTVKIHVRNVIRKLGATNRTMAALHGSAREGSAVVLL